MIQPVHLHDTCLRFISYPFRVWFVRVNRARMMTFTDMVLPQAAEARLYMHTICRPLRAQEESNRQCSHASTGKTELPSRLKDL